MITAIILGGSAPVTLRLTDNPALLSYRQTRKCELAGFMRSVSYRHEHVGPVYVHDAVVDGRLAMVEFYYKPNFGRCYAIEIKEESHV